MSLVEGDRLGAQEVARLDRPGATGPVVRAPWDPIPAVVSGASGTTPAAIDTVTYDVRPIAGSLAELIGVGQPPNPIVAGTAWIRRAGWPRDTLKITPAAVGTPCLIQPYPVGSGSSAGIAYAVYELDEAAETEDCDQQA